MEFYKEVERNIIKKYIHLKTYSRLMVGFFIQIFHQL